MSLFRKPKRNVRQRQKSESDSEETKDFEENESSQVQSTIEKLKGSKRDSKKPGKIATSTSSKSEKKSLLSFDGFDAEADDGEVFRVKKSSQSRRLMKQIKAERKQREKQPPLPATPPPAAPPPPIISKPDPYADLEDDIGIKIKSNLVINKLPDPVESKAPETRTLSGYEAEALHMEEEDEVSEDDEESKNDPLQEILQRGDIPDAAAIFAARKRRQAAREKSDQSFVPLKNNKDDETEKLDDNEEYSDAEEERLTSTNHTDAHANYDIEFDDHWEQQQIRKAMPKSNRHERSQSPDQVLNPEPVRRFKNGNQVREVLTSYNLEGIKDRISKRIDNLKETHRVHCNEADKIVDDLMTSQGIIDEKQTKLPLNMSRHAFYQDLRGYITDLVECFNEKLAKIQFVEEKYHALKADILTKLTERRREDVRDQMRELSSVSNKAGQNTAEDHNEEWARQRRAAEREGRRRRRAQLRSAKLGQLPPHNEGMSSDDELSSHDQTNISEKRQDVENQARVIMTDVVEDFSTLDGVLSRMEEWKRQDPTAYNEAYVSLCLHKIVAPLVTLGLLFWNPVEEQKNELENMAWHKRIANYAGDVQDSDNMFLSYVIEKVVFVKICSMVKSAYDPMSSSQTWNLTQLLTKMRNTYPTLTGSSKQVRQVLTTVIDKMKTCIDHDVYIPLGYSKQCLENPASSHAVFSNRQYWSAFKLLKNILTWHGLIADKILIDLALNSLLYRYLMIGLGVTPNPMDCVVRTRAIINALPNDWKKNPGKYPELEKFIKYLSQLGNNAALSREAVKDVVQQLKSIGGWSEANQLEKKLQNV